MTGFRSTNVFTIPPGVGFLGNLADALLEDRLNVGPIHDPTDPLALSTATIYVPTRRAARALRADIAARLGRTSAILPVVRPLGETDDDSGFFEEDLPASLDLLPPVSAVHATLDLAELVLAWKQALPRAVIDRLDGSPLVAPASPADAIWLGRALFDLMQAVEAEEADLADLDPAMVQSLQQWWQLTAEFLRIARQFWPVKLEELARSSPGLHHNRLIDAETRRLAAGGHPGPVIVAGSTGTRPSIARLIAAVARLDRGAVVLPGLDQTMAPRHWTAMAVASLAATGSDRGSRADPLAAVTIRSHPQFGLMQLLRHLDLPVDAVALVPALGVPPEPLAWRGRAVSLAMLPAAATSDWAEPGLLPDAAVLAQAFAGVSLLVAANEREEAAALAAAMRMALEPRPDLALPTAALITPDRNLARRVVIELARYGIEANDSGGRPLAATEPGCLARLAVAVAFAPGDPVTFASLLKHPLAHFGLAAEEARRLGEKLEMLALRTGFGATGIDGLSSRVAAAEDIRKGRHAPSWLARLNETDVTAARAHSRRIAEALGPLTALRGPHPGPDATAPTDPVHPVSRLATALIEALERISVTGPLPLLPVWDADAGSALAELLGDVADCATGPAMTGRQWIAGLDALMAGVMVKPKAGGHPRAYVWGTLEARLQTVDSVLLAGLNEGTWPSVGGEDPFLSRTMKAGIGLEPPERRIGQAAHDFVMAMGVNRVVLSRSERAGKAPTVASRWVQRLLAVCGPETSAAMVARGAAFIDHIRSRDAVASVDAARRPEPRPDPALQPRNYSFSEVKTLRRDPYAIYGRRILGLDPVEAFAAEPGPRERGTLFHRVLERFFADEEWKRDGRQRMLTIAEDVFAAARLPQSIKLLWRHRLGQAADRLSVWEMARGGDVLHRLSEVRGGIAISDSFGVSGIADRIDLMTDGSAVIVDYKAGGTPSRSVARSLLDPQLALEAHALGLGGFQGVGLRPASALYYIRLNGNEKSIDRIDDPAGVKPRGDAEALLVETLAARAARELEGLLSDLKSGRRGFMSRVIPEKQRQMDGTYDHLARVAEWQIVIDDGEGSGDE